MTPKEDKIRLEALRAPTAELFGISEDIALNLPRFTLIGNRRLWIENHMGIIGYGGGEIRIKVQGGYVVVLGEELKLPAISSGEIVIEGRICDIQLAWAKEEL